MAVSPVIGRAWVTVIRAKVHSHGHLLVVVLIVQLAHDTAMGQPVAGMVLKALNPKP